MPALKDVQIGEMDHGTTGNGAEYTELIRAWPP